MKLFLAVYILLLHLIVATAIGKTDLLQQVQDKYFGGNHFISNIADRHYLSMVAYHRRVDPNVPDNAALFFGDSMIQGLAVGAIVTDAFNFGIGFDTTEGLARRLPLYRAINNARVIVIAIGINDLKANSDADMIANFEHIISLLPEHTPILINAIFPVSDSAMGRVGLNARIGKLNQQLKLLCSQRSSLYFLDFNHAMVRSDGNLLEHYHSGDGLHFNAVSNQIWIDQLRVKIQRIDAIE
jgi:lysophospholipase L1-like esterase